MFGNYPIADTAFLFSDPARVSILTSLLGGESRPAGELARLAGVSPQAATAHLAKMVDGGMLSLRRLGRHHYYRVAKPEVVHALEALAVLTPPPRQSPSTESDSHGALRYARTCYDHLAGQLAVQIWEALETSQMITVELGVLSLTKYGEDIVGQIGIDLLSLRQKRRPLTKACLDWTERKHHLAGALGSALLAGFELRGWVSKRPDSRVVRVTDEGERAIKMLFSISVTRSVRR